MEWLKKGTRTKLGDISEKRRNYRMGCSVPVMVQMENPALEGRVLNLSTTGLKIQLAQAPKAGATYTMWIRGKTLAGGLPPRELGVQARCVWMQRNAKTGTFEAGLLFTDFFGNQLSQVLQFFDRELGIALGDGQQKRSYVRAARRMRITYSNDGRVSNGFTRNLSENGVAIFCKDPIDVGTELTLSIPMETDKLRCTARVVRLRKVEGEDLFEVGARFNTLVEAEHDKLVAFVAGCIAESGAEG